MPIGRLLQTIAEPAMEAPAGRYGYVNQGAPVLVAGFHSPTEMRPAPNSGLNRALNKPGQVPAGSWRGSGYEVNDWPTPALGRLGTIGSSPVPRRIHD